VEEEGREGKREGREGEIERGGIEGACVCICVCVKAWYAHEPPLCSSVTDRVRFLQMLKSYTKDEEGGVDVVNHEYVGFVPLVPPGKDRPRRRSRSPKAAAPTSSARGTGSDEL
jgi:hypothetical protein